MTQLSVLRERLLQTEGIQATTCVSFSKNSRRCTETHGKLPVPFAVRIMCTFAHDCASRAQFASILRFWAPFVCAHAQHKRAGNTRIASHERFTWLYTHDEMRRSEKEIDVYIYIFAHISIVIQYIVARMQYATVSRRIVRPVVRIWLDSLSPIVWNLQCVRLELESNMQHNDRIKRCCSKSR